ncbi:MAG: M20 family metallo-hydrolase [Culturomica sp.]|jgi:acetylornithine deacetylase|nr:M20 family metallo-hydrolase [Culturomica sp.]
MTSEEAIDLLKRMIAVPSFSKEEEQVADLLTAEWTKYGYEPQRKGNNIWVKSKNWSIDKPTVLLDAHIDTVKPSYGWDTDPFLPVVKDEKLYGLGSNDTGGSVVAMMAAFLHLDKTEQSFNLICLQSAEEENTGKHGIQWIVEDLGDITLALIGEPTGMQAAVAEKGLMVVDCVSHGKAGHAARNEGVNAIYAAIPDIEWFRNYRFEKISPLLGEVKMTVTGINAGTLHNMIPDECRFMVDIRVNECYSNQEVYETIQHNIKAEMFPRSFSLGSSSIPLNHTVVERCKVLGLSTYGSPTTSNQAVIPWTSLKIGPGESSRSHTANEYIYLDEIRTGIETYVKILDKLQLDETLG